MTLPFDLAALVTLCLGGAATGFLAGLFGVGGGAITVPILFEIFGVMGIGDDVRMPLAVGTSLAVIIPTSLRSVRSHYLRGAVDLAVLKSWAVPIMVGALAGAAVARYAAPEVFQVAFVVFGTVMSAKLLFGKSTWRIATDMPRGWVLRGLGFFIGSVSSLMGIGGGAISTLVMTLHNRPIHQAVATSAGVGALIAVPGTLGYILAGWGKPGLPPDAIGFVSLIAFALTVPATLVTTPMGVAVAHRLPRRALEVLFGLFLATVALRFVIAVFSG
ncbi:sulfite exporter TauE/SafE family protein [Acuticoccus sp. M5D2P5]|uniref:sulfite exporter TauE/SafE family protein n=1 Tax=Acuticoccus kalidii TaxID=2910977 RepID=UPI001F48381B|nr:sulfite exporter TauE/SafE family protein [Acuticoccus kalidii]MCF3932446.1 sulfite exporter TauE/SafE family protein [Acuticoccus kalidii]